MVSAKILHQRLMKGCWCSTQLTSLGTKIQVCQCLLQALESNSSSPVKISREGAMKTIFYETQKYKLGPITQSSFMQDQHAGDDDLQLPLKFHFRRNGKIS